MNFRAESSLSFLRGLRSLIGREFNSLELRRIYDKFREFTMIPREAYVDNLLLAQRVAALPGCVIECGVWRGGMCAGLASLLGPQRNYYLFDSFEGLPEAQDIDGEAALVWQKNKQSPHYYDNCTAKEDFAARAMALSRCRSYHLMKGWFEDTIPGFTPPEPIALLRLDGDWYDSTMICLESLFKHVIPGGLVLLDDYHTWDGCSRALHDFLSRQTATERIRSFGDICYLQKLPPASGNKNQP